jgi:hypothetical protein
MNHSVNEALLHMCDIHSAGRESVGIGKMLQKGSDRD